MQIGESIWCLVWKLISKKKDNEILKIIHVGTWQLLRQMPTYIEKKHYHVGKRIADIGFVWNPDTLFQPNDILAGPSLCCRKYWSTFTSKTIDRKSIPSSKIFNLLLSCRFEKSRHNICHAYWEHLIIQLLWATAQLLITHVSLIYLIDEFFFLFLV